MFPGEEQQVRHYQVQHQLDDQHHDRGDLSNQDLLHISLNKICPSRLLLKVPEAKPERGDLGPVQEDAVLEPGDPGEDLAEEVKTQIFKIFFLVFNTFF